MNERTDVAHGETSAHDQGHAEGEDHLAVELGRLARELEHQPHESMLEAIVRSAVELIPGVEGGSISVVTGRKNVTSEAPTSDVPRQLDQIQMQEREGPCLDAAYEQKTVRVPNFETEERWPAFARRAAAETEARSMLSFQLFVESDNLGALNLYSSSTDAFTDESEHVGLLVAAHAAVAFAGARRDTQLHEAIASRDVISQAKGILMERHKITSQQAFILLAEGSSRTNTKLYELAEHLVSSGELRNGRE